VPRPPQSRSCPSYYFYTSCGRGGLTPEGSSGCVQRRPRDTSQDRPPPEAEWQLELRGHRRPWRRTRTSATATGEGVSHSVPMFVDVQGLLTPKWFGAARVAWSARVCRSRPWWMLGHRSQRRGQAHPSRSRRRALRYATSLSYFGTALCRSSHHDTRHHFRIDIVMITVISATASLTAGRARGVRLIAPGAPG
jgi:hypothetical protein